VFRLTARIGPKVDKSRHASLEEALAALEDRLGAAGRERTREVLGRTYDAGSQVTGRFELRGPGGMRGGVDVRGDGSAQAYRGWVRKQPVEAQPGETPADALRRALQA
jgi:hypothetical protein